MEQRPLNNGKYTKPFVSHLTTLSPVEKKYVSPHNANAGIKILFAYLELQYNRAYKKKLPTNKTFIYQLTGLIPPSNKPIDCIMKSSGNNLLNWLDINALFVGSLTIFIIKVINYAKKYSQYKRLRRFFAKHKGE